MSKAKHSIFKEAIKIPLIKPFFNDEIKEAVNEVLENERYVLGESVYKFEEELARYFNVKYAVTVSSGTNALHFALIALGLRKGDRVITSPFSFIATANSIIHAGGEPVFADIENDTLNINPKEIRKKLYKDVKVIMPVHLYGYPAEMDEINQIAKENNLNIVEDACQAHGALYKGRKVGSLGDIGCLSFYPSKNLTVFGDGGAVLTNNEDVAGIVKKLRDAGRTSKYTHDIIGYTARLNTINAAIGRIQLKYLDKWNENRRRIARKYNELLSDIEDIKLPPTETSEIKPVYHLYVIRTKYRDELKKWLEENGIECGVHYPLPIHLQPVYRRLYGYNEGEYPVSESVSREVLSIPMHPFLTNEEVNYISEKIHEFFDKP